MTRISSISLCSNGWLSGACGVASVAEVLVRAVFAVVIAVSAAIAAGPAYARVQFSASSGEVSPKPAAFQAGGGGQTPPATVNVEVEPVTCWWRTSTSSVRVGQPFDVVLTCAALETEATKAVIDRGRLAAASCSTSTTFD
jgi:hypothetical protein